MKTQLIFILTFSILYSTLTHSQSWETSFPPDSIGGFPANILGLNVEPTQDGGYLIGGEEDFQTGAVRHYLTLGKTDGDGIKEWQHVYDLGGITDDEIIFLEELPNQEIIIGGKHFNTPFLKKLNSQGEIIWEKMYESDTLHIFHDGGVFPDQSMLLVGNSNISIGDPFYIFLLKVNSDGEKIWEKSIQLSEATTVYAMEITSDGGALLVGNFGDQIGLYKINQDGELEWNLAYSFLSNDQVFTIEQTLDQGFIIGGSTQNLTTTLPFVFKIDSTGSADFVTFFSNGILDRVTGIAVRPDSSYVVVGSVYSFWAASFNTFLAEIDQSGDVSWEGNFTPQGLRFAAIDITQDGCIIIAGKNAGGMMLKKLGELSSTKNLFSDNISLNIFPNPFQDQTTFQVEGKNLSTIQLQIFNISGQLIREENYSDSVFNFHSNNLTNGFYFYRLLSKNELLATGKLIVQK